MLKKGTGTPYVAIFDSSENPIIDLQYNIPLGVFVVGLKYTYVEDGCDTAELTIETGNVNLTDHPSLQYLMPIKLQWGWIYYDGSSEPSPIRSLVVKDYSLSFSPEGVKVTLELSDSSFLLKKDSSDYSGADPALDKKDDFINYTQKVLEGTNHPIQIVKSINIQNSITDGTKR